MNDRPIPVVDLFAGPGGLGEGFAAHRRKDGTAVFRVRLSIEMDSDAHRTLELRSFFHQFERDDVPEAYYEHVRNARTRESLFGAYPHEAARARAEAWHAELGKASSEDVGRRIDAAVGNEPVWVLCGGPPCQAYSIVGRSRRGGIDLKDHRLYLYREYLKILAAHEPPVFIMENVKGLLSSADKGGALFAQILQDLRTPGASSNNRPGASYRIYPLARSPGSTDSDRPTEFKPQDYIILCEKYGIPQSRHRVILLGIREDIACPPIPALVPAEEEIPVSRVLNGLPPLRSGLTRQRDSLESWQAIVASFRYSEALLYLPNGSTHEMRDAVCKAIDELKRTNADRGAEFSPRQVSSEYRSDWFLDARLGGVCNHISRPHMASDLHRYLFAACYAKVTGRSPELRDFPAALLPAHKNVNVEGKQEYFDDRFRVQLQDRPSMTITCHIAKDGHYYIHPDPSQCRSFTVREAARVQTFPDNYFFCGTRTAQYRQVGNAVPPLLATQIAAVVSSILAPEERER